MVAAVGSVGGSSSVGSSNVSGQIAALQRLLAGLQKQMTGMQKNLASMAEGDAKKAVEQQLQAMSAQMQMIQQQISALQSEAGRQNVPKSVPPADSIEAAAKASRVGSNMMLGGRIDTEV